MGATFSQRRTRKQEKCPNSGRARPYVGGQYSPFNQSVQLRDPVSSQIDILPGGNKKETKRGQRPFFFALIESFWWIQLGLSLLFRLSFLFKRKSRKSSQQVHCRRNAERERNYVRNPKKKEFTTLLIHNFLGI